MKLSDKSETVLQRLDFFFDGDKLVCWQRDLQAAMLHFCRENAANDPQCSSHAPRGVPIARTATALCSGARVRYGLHIVPTSVVCISYKTYNESAPFQSKARNSRIKKKREKDTCDSVFIFYYRVATARFGTLALLSICPFATALKSEEQRIKTRTIFHRKNTRIVAYRWRARRSHA